MKTDAQVLRLIAQQFCHTNYQELTPLEEKIADELIRHGLLSINHENVVIPNTCAICGAIAYPSPTGWFCAANSGHKHTQ